MKRTEESAEISRILFELFDINKNGKIELWELKTVMKSLQLFPTEKELKRIVRSVSTSPNFSVSWEEFRAMRELRYECEMNVVVEFKKFDVHRIQRGLITRECVEAVYEKEGLNGKQLEEAVAEFMCHDRDGDGVITFKELYDSMLQRLSQEWLEWIFSNLKEGVPPAKIEDVITSQGIKPHIAKEVISRTQKEGKQYLQRTFADYSKAYLYVF